MADVEDYSTTAASNTDDFPENQAPSTVNDGGRETQADIAQWHQRITGTVTAGGTADALTATFSPAHTALAERMIVIKAASDNATTTPTLNLDGLGAKTIVKNGNEALVAGDIQAGAVLNLWYSTANTNWELLNPATPASGSVVYAHLNLSNNITAGDLAPNSVRMSELYTTQGSYGTTSIGAGSTWAQPEDGYYFIDASGTTMEFQTNFNGTWRTVATLSNGGGLSPEGFWVISGTTRIINTGGSSVAIYYQRAIG